MPNTAFIFPGQGAQYVGMGKDLFENSQEARELFQRADDVLGFSLSKICFEGPEDELRQTKNTQPAIFLHSAVLLNLLKKSDVSFTAGHSLGEYTSLLFAKSLNFEDALKLVRLRGVLMQKAGEEKPGTLAAVVGLEPDTVKQVCNDASVAGIVQCANFNSPGQIVISGSIAGVRQAMVLAKEKGAKMVKELVVSGAFHSPLMESAQHGLSSAIDSSNISEAKIPVYTNVSSKPIRSSSDIRESLKKQLTSAVMWEDSVRNMINDGAATFVEIGPGKVLQGLVKRINPDAKTFGIDKYKDLEQIF
jgi:[acyl-carrier-protein] S-malonyltransferase